MVVGAAAYEQHQRSCLPKRKGKQFLDSRLRGNDEKCWRHFSLCLLSSGIKKRNREFFVEPFLSQRLITW
jgi:hypothetical protein